MLIVQQIIKLHSKTVYGNHQKNSFLLREVVTKSVSISLNHVSLIAITTNETYFHQPS